MKLTAIDVKKISKLARLKLDEAKLTKLSCDLNKIIPWVHQLNEIDTSGIEPITTIVASVNKLRADIVTSSNNSELLMQTAPESKYNYFTVVKVLND